MSRTLLSSDPDCRQHKPPIVVLEAFDRLLTSDAEIRDKRLSDAEATQELGLSLRAAMAQKDSSLLPKMRSCPLDRGWTLTGGCMTTRFRATQGPSGAGTDLRSVAGGY